MEKQKEDAWAISDPRIAEAYRSGKISEETLKYIMNGPEMERELNRMKSPLDKGK